MSAIYEEQVDGLYFYGCKFTNDRELIKDCIHDVFVKLYEKEDLSSIQNMKFYLLRSLKNKLIYESIKKSTKEVYNATFSYSQEPSSDYRFDFIEDDETKQLKFYVEKAFENLTNKQKEAVYLYYIEELSYDEIGQMLNMNRQSVKNTVHRALLRLRERLGDKPPSFLMLYIKLLFPANYFYQN